ncbi:hypothetical protein H5410_031571 [Solanum commersonii]|uniref:Uncharacterized protein n=1 Tax=Solanum commersonii TaxID=4109 RepID=A0A9J5YIQ9_SOLCO|nr:hypothetical protein H5410_031571 [Solanum commersonii]
MEVKFIYNDCLTCIGGCRKMGLNNSSWLLEASEFPSALGLFCSLHDDFKFAAHRAFKFSYQMHNEVTVIKNVVVLKHGLVADG